MHLTLTKVHRLIGQVLGAEAVTLQNYVQRIVEDNITCGIYLAGDGVLYYSPDWWALHIDTPEKAKHVVLFEVMKKLLGVQKRSADWVTRVATGAVINAYLYHHFGFHELPRALYPANELPLCLMRPNARGYHSRLRRIYKGIWTREKRFTSISNVENALRILFKDESLLVEGMNPDEINVLGFENEEGEKKEEEPDQRGHKEETDGKPEIRAKVHVDSLPPDIIEHMAKGVQDTQSAAFSDIEMDYVTKKLKSSKSFETQLVEEYILDRISKKARSVFTDSEPEESMLPLRISNRDAFRLALGWYPLSYENEIEKEDKKGGLAVYVDVSGSFEAYIPYTLGVIEAMEDVVEKIFQFSNIVSEISMEDLKKNNVRIVTTGGTDFDCIVRHAVDNNFDKVMIITDGWADVTNDKLRELADEKIEKVFVLLVTCMPGGKSNSKAMQDLFIKNTWLGRRYKAVADLAEAFR